MKDYSASIEEPVVVELVNKTNEIQTFRYYLCNFTETLQPDDAVKVSVTSSETMAYYTKIKEMLENAQASKDLVIEFPTPLNVGSPLDTSVLDPEVLRTLIERNMEEEVYVTLKQGNVLYNKVSLDGSSETSCDFTLDENNYMTCSIESEDETNYYCVIGDVQGFNDFDVFRPH